jgi:lipopolysaccharide biosynthesis glycosyltransferase
VVAYHKHATSLKIGALNVEKRAIVTLCIGDNASAFGKYAHHAMSLYAKKIHADFIKLDQPKIRFTAAKHFNPILFEKYQVFDVLGSHDRVLFLDTDILVTPQAPDVFDVVPVDKIGGVFEDIGTEQEHRRGLIVKVQEVLGNVGWAEGFMNSGVFVVSKMHRGVFRMYQQHGFYDGCYEQTNTNWYMHKAGFQIVNIDARFNFMGMMRVFHGPVHREAYFIHYAGGGLFPWVPRVEQMKNDHEYFYEHKNVPSYEDA